MAWIAFIVAVLATTTLASSTKALLDSATTLEDGRVPSGPRRPLMKVFVAMRDTMPHKMMQNWISSFANDRNLMVIGSSMSIAAIIEAVASAHEEDGVPVAIVTDINWSSGEVFRNGDRSVLTEEERRRVSKPPEMIDLFRSIPGGEEALRYTIFVDNSYINRDVTLPIRIAGNDDKMLLSRLHLLISKIQKDYDGDVASWYDSVVDGRAQRQVALQQYGVYLSRLPPH